jgi:hypothetical protein
MAQILNEKHLDLGFIIRLAILELPYKEIDKWEISNERDFHTQRVHLTRKDFFSLYQKSQEIEVDPNMLLSYAFIQTLLDILRL